MIVSVAGELDMSTAPTLDQQVRLAETEVVPPASIILDLSGVTFIGAAALTVLMEHHYRCTEHGSALWLATGHNPRIRRLLVLTSLDTVLATADTVDECTLASAQTYPA